MALTVAKYTRQRALRQPGNKSRTRREEGRKNLFDGAYFTSIITHISVACFADEKPITNRCFSYTAATGGVRLRDIQDESVEKNARLFCVYTCKGETKILIKFFLIFEFSSFFFFI